MSDFSLQFFIVTHTSFVKGNHNTRMISANLFVTISSPCSLSTLLMRHFYNIICDFFRGFHILVYELVSSDCDHD